MENRETIDKYVKNFKRYLSRFLKPEIGVRSTIHPSTESGAVLEFSLGENVRDEVVYTPSSESVSASFDQLDQQFIANPSSVQFSGTSTVLEPNRIILIKGEDDLDEWNDKAAQRDAKKVSKPPIKSEG